VSAAQRATGLPRPLRGPAPLVGRPYEQQPTRTMEVRPDPAHTLDAIREQLANDNGGFVRNYPTPDPAKRREIMGYHESLPATHELARRFAVFNKYFCSVPGPTYPNRLFALSGTSDGYAENHNRYYRQPSVFRRLSEAQRPWHIYRGGIPACVYLFWDMNTPEAMEHVWPMSTFFRDVAGDPAEFPAFSLIEPDYAENDDHPPHHLMAGQRLIADVYNALRVQRPRGSRRCSSSPTMSTAVSTITSVPPRRGPRPETPRVHLRPLRRPCAEAAGVSVD